MGCLTIQSTHYPAASFSAATTPITGLGKKDFAETVEKMLVYRWLAEFRKLVPIPVFSYSGIKKIFHFFFYSDVPGSRVHQCLLTGKSG